MSVTIKGTQKVDMRLKDVKNKLSELPSEAFDVFVKNTPVRNGNARRNTKLVNNKKIQTNYPYAARLNQGYSEQNRKGMVEPTLQFIRKRVKEITKGK